MEISKRLGFSRMLAVGAVLLCCLCRSVMADASVDKSPSKDKIQWLGAKTSLESLAQFDYVDGSGSTDLGGGRTGAVEEREIRLRQLVAHRCWRAFLVRGGVEWERFAFRAPSSAMLPSQLHVLDLYLGVDFRFSRHDMIRVQARPGFYTDFEDVDGGNWNIPAAVAYSRTVNRGFQWAVGLSLNPWRHRRWLGGGGFRWQINDRWKLKMMLPEPQIEYRAKEDLHLFVGGDFRGDTYRVSHDFGSRRGQPAFDNALLDYQEVRVGSGFSWNIKPLLELNFQAGYMLDRAFDYHNNGLLLVSRPSPYFSANLQFLFEVGGREEALDTKGQPFQIPNLERVFPKVL